MKKAGLFVIAILLLSLLPLISAQDEVPGLEGAPLGGEIQAGQQQYEQYTTAQNKSEYLKQEWMNIVSKHKVIGPVHNFFVAHPLLFQILFAHPYEISVTFLFILILWVFVLVTTADVLGKSGILKGLLPFAIGIGAAIILAQVRAIQALSNFFVNLVFAKDAWWIRLIVWLLIMLTLVIFYYIGRITAAKMKKSREEKEKKATEEKAEQTEKKLTALEKGMKEGTELKKEMPSYGEGYMT
jgi:uncharacterized membrane protein